MTVARDMQRLASDAREASRALAAVSTARKNDALARAADALESEAPAILAANAKDLAAARKAELAEAMLDRLALDGARVAKMAEGLRQVAALPDPVGEVLSETRRPNGLVLRKVRVPIGVVAILYESRPNVTADAAALCLKAGSACVLRGGKEAIRSNLAIARALRGAIHAAGLPEACVSAVETTDRAAVGALLKLDEFIDVVIPRGGKSLIERVVAEARMPVLKHFEGICHVFVERTADLGMAAEIVMNAKCQRPGVCNAMETLLVDEKIAGTFLPSILKRLAGAGVALVGDAAARKIDPAVGRATKADWRTEYLALKLSVAVVPGLEEAIRHVNTYGSGHTDAIVTEDEDAARRFVGAVDSGCVFVNASTRFSDGFEFGLGAEIGISTDKLHARGPMGLEELCTYKWVGWGAGQVRE